MAFHYFFISKTLEIDLDDEYDVCLGGKSQTDLMPWESNEKVC